MRYAETVQCPEAGPLLQTGPAAYHDNAALSSPIAMSDSSGFADALVAQLPGLRRYATALAGNRALADDLVQDCIERALGQQTQLREVTRLAPWLRRILYHLY